MTTVLLVEDDVPMAALYERALQGRGYEVLVAQSTIEALNHLQQNAIDVIVLDMNLPDAPGTHVLDHIEAEPELSHIRVIVMTGFSRYREQEHRPQVLKIITKPVVVSTLVSEVGAAVAG